MLYFEKIHPSWGLVVQSDSVDDYLSQPENFWKQLLYDHKLLVCKKVKMKESVEYGKFGGLFGIPSYAASPESPENVGKRTTPYYGFSNVTHPRIGTSAMRWHADFPNYAVNPFPIRTLLMKSNPNPEGGITGFLNVTDSIPLLSKELQDLIPRVRVLQQDWFKPGGVFVDRTNLQEHDLLKVHPVTGEKTLRLNMYNVPNKLNEGWICGVKIDGVEQPDCDVIRIYLEAILDIPGMSYFHKWDESDILVYDNWTSVHNRSDLQLKQGEERMLVRINIDHDLNYSYKPRTYEEALVIARASGHEKLLS